MLQIQGEYCKDVKIFTDNVAESALSTIQRLADSIAFKDRKIRIMPDCHDGKGIVIGFSCPIDIEKDHVNPEIVGCDIGCTISAVFFNKPIEDKNIKDFEFQIRQNIPFGFLINESQKIDVDIILKRFNSVLDKLCSVYPLMSKYRLRMNSEHDLKLWCSRIGMDYETFLKSIGTVGGGNHFLEYDINEEDKKYCICVHLRQNLIKRLKQQEMNICQRKFQTI